MADNVHFSPVLALICFFLLAPSPLPCNAQTLKTCGLNSIYQLGDSVSDTGNLIQEHPESAFAKLPYGETFFKNATGRCSNGLLMIDYFGKHPNNIIASFLFLIHQSTIITQLFIYF